MLKQLSIIPIFFLLIILPISGIQGQSTDTIGNTLKVTDHCGIDITGAASFGDLGKGEVSDQTEFTITGKGSIPAKTIKFYATDWLSGGVNIIDGERSRFSTTSTGNSLSDYNGRTSSNGTGDYEQSLQSVSIDTITSLAHDITATIYWQVEVILNDDEFSGDLTQNITIQVFDCDTT